MVSIQDKKSAIMALYRPHSGIRYTLSQTQADLSGGGTCMHLTHTRVEYEPGQDLRVPSLSTSRPASKYARQSHCGPVWEFTEELDEARYIEKNQYHIALHMRQNIQQKRAQKINKYNTQKMFWYKAGPPWYQELSPFQLSCIDALQNAMRLDYQQNTTIRTHETLTGMGIVPRPAEAKVKWLLKYFYFNPEMFLLKLYQFSEPGRKDYSVNDKILLSAIVHLTIRTVFKELHIRIPSPERETPEIKIKLRSKKRKYVFSPYLKPFPLIKQNKKSGVYMNNHREYPSSPYFDYKPNMYEEIEVDEPKPETERESVSVTSNRSKGPKIPVRLAKKPVILRKILKKPTGYDPLPKIPDETSLGDVNPEDDVPEDTYVIDTEIDYKKLMEVAIRENRKGSFTLNIQIKTASEEILLTQEVNPFEKSVGELIVKEQVSRLRKEELSAEEEEECMCGEEEGEEIDEECLCESESEPEPEINPCADPFWDFSGCTCGPDGSFSTKPKPQSSSDSTESGSCACCNADTTSKFEDDHQTCKQKPSFDVCMCGNIRRNTASKSSNLFYNSSLRLTGNNNRKCKCTGSSLKKSTVEIENRNSAIDTDVEVYAYFEDLDYSNLVKCTCRPKSKPERELVREITAKCACKTAPEQKFNNKNGSGSKQKETPCNCSTRTSQPKPRNSSNLSKKPGSKSDLQGPNQSATACDENSPRSSTQNRSSLPKKPSVDQTEEFDEKFSNLGCTCGKKTSLKLPDKYRDVDYSGCTCGPTPSDSTESTQSSECNCEESEDSADSLGENEREIIGEDAKLHRNKESLDLDKVADLKEEEKKIGEDFLLKQCKCTKPFEMPKTEDDIPNLEEQVCKCEEVYKQYIRGHSTCLTLYNAYMMKMHRDICDYLGEIHREQAENEEDQDEDAVSEPEEIPAKKPCKCRRKEALDEMEEEEIEEEEYFEEIQEVEEVEEKPKAKPKAAPKSLLEKSKPVKDIDRYKLTEMPLADFESRYVVLEEFPATAKLQMRVLKRVLNSMKEDGFPLAKLPECYRLPHFQLWLRMRSNQYISMDQRERINFSNKGIWAKTGEIERKISAPDLGLSIQQIRELTWAGVYKHKQLVTKVKERYYKRLKHLLINEARDLFWTTRQYDLPFSSFRDCYYAYLPSDENHVMPFRPWKRSEGHDMRKVSCPL